MSEHGVAHRGVERTQQESLHWKLTLGEKPFVARGSRPSINRASDPTLNQPSHLAAVVVVAAAVAVAVVVVVAAAVAAAAAAVVAVEVVVAAAAAAAAAVVVVVVVVGLFVHRFYIALFSTLEKDSLRSHVIPHEWLFYSAFLTIQRSDVVTALTFSIP